MDIAIIGGGAAGFFAAITCAEANPGCRVAIFERGRAALEKVRISGGGRCNTTHACFDARALVKHYPRGERELLGPFLQFGPAETVAWFAARGVALKTEADGRMFPETDDSQTIVQCLLHAAQRAGVQLHYGSRIERLQAGDSGGWALWPAHAEAPLRFDRVLVASGSNPAVWDMLRQLGHSIVEPVPSLFTFNTKDTRLRELSGLSVAEVALRVPGTRLAAQGPLLVTHWGLSGPAVLRLSAWGARVLHGMDYRFPLEVNFCPALSAEELSATLAQFRAQEGKKTVAANARLGLPLRLWQHLSAAAGIAPTQRWAELDRQAMQALAAQIGAASFAIAGKSTFKEEFVTAGGVLLKEINFKTFESKICPGLFLAGEVLDIDAITGGFNFQAAWTGGWLAGQAMAI
jgi:hypothetical protein